MPHGHIEVENPRLTLLSQNEETRNIATSFIESPTNFSGMYTYQYEQVEESARSWTDRSRVSYGIGGIFYVGIAIDSLLLIRKQ